MNGRKPYEGICTEAEMLTLIENIDKCPDVEWDDYEIDGQKLSYPMWKVVTSNTSSYEDYLKYFNSTKGKSEPVKDDDTKVGIVEPEDAFEDQTEVDVFTESSSYSLFSDDIVSKINKLMSSSRVGAVKPSNEDMPSKSTKQVTELDTTNKNDVKVEVAKKATTGVGVVKPSDALGKQTTVDITDGKGLSAGDNQLSDKTGIVKPSTEFGGNTKPVTSVDGSKVISQVKDAPKGDPKVNMIKPDAAFSKPKNAPITFKDFIK